MANFLNSFLCQLIIPILEILEERSAREMFHDDEDVFEVLEHIQQPDDVGVLADLKDFYLSLVELKIFGVHLLLLENLDGYLLASLLMLTELDSTEFTFTNGFLEIIMVKNVLVSNCLFDLGHPFLMLLLLL